MAIKVFLWITNYSICIMLIGLVVACGKGTGSETKGRDVVSKNCKTVSELNAESDVVIQPHQRMQSIVGNGRIPLYVAPAKECVDNRRTVKVGDTVYLLAYSTDLKFALVDLSGMPGDDKEKIVWIEDLNLNGGGESPQGLSCEVHPEAILESDCKWSPPAPKTAIVLNDEQAYCEQKERSEFDKTHKRQDYFLIEAKGRTPLYSLPNEQCQSKKFLVQGDLVDLIEFYPTQEFGDSTYARVIYFSKALNRDVVGWVPSKSLCRLTASGGNCENVKRR
jgi:hypothetical protein